MRWRSLLVGSLVLASACTARGPRPPDTQAIPPSPTLRIGLTTAAGVQIRTMPLEEYVAGAILGEVSAAGLEPAVARRVLALQAITARTYGLANRGRHARDGFDLCDREHCQLVRMTGPDAARQMAIEAASGTQGELITFEGSIIEAVFHADCGGSTSAADAVWGGTGRKYLQPVTDAFCAHRPAASWTWRVNRDDLGRALAREIPAGLGSAVARIEVLERDVADRVDDIAVVMPASAVSSEAPAARSRLKSQRERETTMRGIAFRAAVLRAFGPRSLRSTRFSVVRDGDAFVFAGRGNGHGVGLCQAGAIARLKAGQSVEDVIRFYYRGVKIQHYLRAALSPAPPAPAGAASSAPIKLLSLQALLRTGA